jgi:hypothetical protein
MPFFLIETFFRYISLAGHTDNIGNESSVFSIILEYNMQNITTPEQAHAALATFLGYPQCCIDAFNRDENHDTIAAFPNGPWIGSGFIPCLQCASKAALNFGRFVDEKITPNRKCPAPFPQLDAWDGHKAYLKDLWKDVKKPTIRVNYRWSIRIPGVIRLSW